jgi:hypothetical protein
MRLRDLLIGDEFRFDDRDGSYTYLGNGWYGDPTTGRDWWRNPRDNPEVERVTDDALALATER